MKYLVAANTDVGTYKDMNEDSLVVKHAMFEGKELVMAMICDGMGGLSKGELASATVIRAFVDWFNNEWVSELEHLDWHILGEKWALKLKDLNYQILEYGHSKQMRLGTTFTGLMMVDDAYMICHVGDSRVYAMDPNIRQLTEDHTYVQQQINQGTMTLDQASHDKRKHILTQCVGASSRIEPQLFYGQMNDGALLLCSDGFRNTVNDEEIARVFEPASLTSQEIMNQKIAYFFKLVKQRHEQDNISCIVIRVLGGAKHA